MNEWLINIKEKEGEKEKLLDGDPAFHPTRD